MNIMIKPVSGHCNIDCRYCFYKEGHTTGPSMSLDTAKTVIDRLSLFLRGGYPLVFQGGEPLLAGYGYFEHVFHYLEEKELYPQILIQTNGTLLDDEYARLFASHHVLLGVSLDGNLRTHNRYRSDFSDVMRGIDCLRRHGCQFNILTVVTDELCLHLEDVYEYYRREGFEYQQYIPCMSGPGQNPYLFLSQENYSRFLIRLYDLWRTDINAGRYVYIRYFENLLQILAGYQPEDCGASGVCSTQFLVESDGSVYPCDFFVENRFHLGSLLTDDPENILQHLSETDFIPSSRTLPGSCWCCPYLHLCRGGCKRYRDKDGRYLYCSSLKSFFNHTLADMRELLKTACP